MRQSYLKIKFQNDLIRMIIKMLTVLLFFSVINCESKQCSNLTKNDYCNEQLTISKRQLGGFLDPTKCTISGSGISSTIIVGETVSVQVNTKDSTGNNIGVGGNQIYISITNQCTRGNNMICTPVSGAKNVVSSPIITLMNDNGDGTYSYSYSISKPGNITIAITMIAHADVSASYYNSNYLSAATYYNIFLEDQTCFIWIII